MIGSLLKSEEAALPTADLLREGIAAACAPFSEVPGPLVPEEIAVYAKDPLGYVVDRFQWGEGLLEKHEGPDTWQREILEELTAGLQAGAVDPDEVVGVVVLKAVASGHGVGKSALIAQVICWAMDTRADTRGTVTANTEQQLLTKTWPEISKWFRLGGLDERFTRQATRIASRVPGHEDSWRLDRVTWSENHPEAFAGLHNHGSRILIVFDEGSAIADIIWETTEGVLTDTDTEIIWLVLGNPTRTMGRFRECWRKFRSMWSTLQVDSRTSRFTNKALLDQMVELYGITSDYVKVRILGRFPAASVKQFIPSDLIDAARARVITEPQVRHAAKILTLDPAWSGDDEYVIGLRQGLAFTVRWTGRQIEDDVWLAKHLAEIEDQEQADAVFIDFGYGTGVKSIGDSWGRTWQLVSFGGTSTDPGMLNKRGDMWNKAKQWLANGGVLPDDQVLCDDLGGPEATVRLDGKVVLESKQDMKNRGLPSPGRGDALALSFAAPVAPKIPRGLRPQGSRALSEYDPHEEAA